MPSGELGTTVVKELNAAFVEPFREKRFLFVLGTYAKMGGAERQAILLAKTLKTQVGCHVAFLSWQRKGRVADELAELDIPALQFPLKWYRGRAYRLLDLYRLSSFIRTEARPDYLLPYVSLTCKIIGLIWRFTGAKFTWWNQRDEGRDVYGSRLERHVLKDVPSIVSNSFEGRDFLVSRFGLSGEDIRVINNGIALPNQAIRSNWRSRLGLEDGDRLLTMVANLTRYKDHETLLRAFASLRSSNIGKRCHLALAGRLDETTENLKVLAFDLGLCNSVHFLGALSAPSELLAVTDLAVHSSTTEGCPNAVLEAMAHGRCVCGTNISGLRQAIGTESSEQVLVPPQNSSALFETMRRLIGAPQERIRLGRDNLERIRTHFSPATLLENVLGEVRNRSLDGTLRSIDG